MYLNTQKKYVASDYEIKNVYCIQKNKKNYANKEYIKKTCCFIVTGNCKKILFSKIMSVVWSKNYSVYIKYNHIS